MKTFLTWLFLVEDLDFFLLLRFSARHFFIIDLGFLLPFHFGVRNFVLSAEIFHAKGCVCKINKSNFKIAEYFVVVIKLHSLDNVFMSSLDGKIA